MANTLGTEAGKRSTVFVSARGGLVWTRDASGAMVASQAAGGLSTVLRAVIHPEDLWVCAAQSKGDRAMARRLRGGASVHEVLGREIPFKLVTTPNVGPFAEVLAQIQLEQTSCLSVFDTLAVDRAYEDYVGFNDAMTAAAIPHIDPLGRAMLNDHHTYLMPSRLRKIYPHLKIWLFVHMSMSGPYDWRVLPRRMREPILRSMLECDMLVFHSGMWAKQFIDVCDELDGVAVDRQKMIVSSGHGNTAIRVSSLPADKEGWLARQNTDEVKRLIAEFKRERVFRLVAVDRSDRIKNILRGYRAFELLLEHHPELCGQVTFYSLVVPSRQDLRMRDEHGRTVYPYRDYMNQIRREARRINKKYRLDGWAPLRLFDVDDRNLACALLSIYDALLVIPLIEGMNSVAKEGPLLNRDGTVLLSPSVGAAALLTAAIMVDQFDVWDIYESLLKVIRQSPGARRRVGSQLHTVVWGEDPDRWIRKEVAALGALARR
jgi:trehalose 6-phosphate synthase